MDITPVEAEATEPEATEEEVETVTLVVSTPMLDEFVGFIDGEGYAVTPAGVEVPAEVADTLVEQALSVSVLLTVKDD